MRKKTCSELGAEEMTAETTMRFHDGLIRLVEI